MLVLARSLVFFNNNSSMWKRLLPSCSSFATTPTGPIQVARRKDQMGFGPAMLQRSLLDERRFLPTLAGRFMFGLAKGRPFGAFGHVKSDAYCQK
jgi:hypothetical protein